MAEHDYSPLDPDEGPTIWARQSESNSHTYELATGTDPTNPTDTFQLSAGEISELAALVSQNSE